METIFKAVLEMSLTASVLSVAVMAARFAGKRLFTGRIMVLLWIAVIVKLTVPFSIPSYVSVYNLLDTESVYESLEQTDGNGYESDNDGVLSEPIQNGTVGTFEEQIPEGDVSLEGNVSSNEGAVTPPKGDVMSPTADGGGGDVSLEAGLNPWRVAGGVYLAVASALAAVVTVGYVLSAVRLRNAEKVSGARAERIASDVGFKRSVRFVTVKGHFSSMVFGIVRPTVVLPEDHARLTDEKLRYLLMHEYEHIRHCDTLVNLVMLTTLCIHWFNPIVWLSYIMFTRDTEVACDEGVLSRIAKEERKAFAETLVCFADRTVKRHPAAALEFGNGNTKERVERIMKFKKAGIISIIAAVLIAVIIIAIFATGANNAGGNGSSDGGTDGNGNGKNESAAAEIQEKRDKTAEEADKIAGLLSDKYDFGGMSFMWIGGGTQSPSDDGEGDVMDEALYAREKEIEKKLGITVDSYIPPSTEDGACHPVVDEVKKDNLAGGGKYFAGYGTHAAVIFPLIGSGELSDLSQNSAIELTNPWWTASLKDSYILGGGLYALDGDAVSTNYYDTHCVLFNKTLAEKYGIGDLYSAVKGGEWTLDKMFSAAAAVPVGDGIYRYADPDGIAILRGADAPLLSYNADLMPYLPETLPTDVKTVAEKLSAVFGDEEQTAAVRPGEAVTFSEKYDGYKNKYKMFADGKVLFCFGEIPYGTDELSGVDYGILPLPKESAEQKSYVSLASSYAQFGLFIHDGAPQKDLSGAVLEAYGAYGRKYLKNAAFDSILKKDGSYDYDSYECLELIYETKEMNLLESVSVNLGCNCNVAVNSVLDRLILGDDTAENAYFLQAKLFNAHVANLLLDISSDGK